MANTTNFGWETPDDTDLVKDGAAAMRTLGNSIDSSFVDLKGGTTGQVLSKNSNTDLDFTWVAQDDSNAIQNAIVDAKGDLIAASAADTPARLAVGANDTLLIADSSQSTGLKWGGGWTTFSFTPSGLTVGNGTLTNRYAEIGKTVFVESDLVFGSTTSITGLVVFGLPVTAKIGAYMYAGTVSYGDAGVGTYMGAAGFQTTSNYYLAALNSAGTYTFETAVSATVPFTWTTNDRITVRLTYEAA